MSKPQKSGVGAAIGAAIVGFEQAVFRTTPPAEEMIQHARPDEPIPAGDGGFLILLPDDARPDDSRTERSIDEHPATRLPIDK